MTAYWEIRLAGWNPTALSHWITIARRDLGSSSRGRRQPSDMQVEGRVFSIQAGRWDRGRKNPARVDSRKPRTGSAANRRYPNGTLCRWILCYLLYPAENGKACGNSRGTLLLSLKKRCVKGAVNGNSYVWRGCLG